MKDWLMVPRYVNPNDEAERRYNIAHKATRRIVECAYGILRERFPALNHLRVSPKYACKIIMSAATLHNIATKDDFEYNQNQAEEHNEILHEPPNNLARYNELLAYFM